MCFVPHLPSTLQDSNTNNLGESISTKLSQINKQYSIIQSVKGIESAGILKSLSYGLAKYQKKKGAQKANKE